LLAQTSEKCANACAHSLALFARDPDELGDQPALLIDGACDRALTLGPDGLRRKLIDTATMLINAQLR